MTPSPFPISAPAYWEVLYDFGAQWVDFYQFSKSLTTIYDDYQQQLFDDLILQNRVYDC